LLIIVCVLSRVTSLRREICMYIYIYIYVIFSRYIILVPIIGIYPFCGKGPRHLLWVGSQAECGEITVSGITDCQITVSGITDCQITVSGITDCQITVSGITNRPNYFLFLLHIHNLQIWLRSWW